MTKNEVMMVIDTLRKQGYSDEDILECFYNIFADDKITLKELTDIVNLLGYELTDEFKALPMISKKVAGIVASSWQTIVLKYIDAKGYTDPEVYKRANISKQAFSKIRSDASYHPNKETAIQMCFGLKLNLEESLDLLDRAGYTLSSTSKRDLIIMSFIMNEKYDISELNDVLYSINLKLFPIV